MQIILLDHKNILTRPLSYSGIILGIIQVNPNVPQLIHDTAAENLWLLFVLSVF